MALAYYAGHGMELAGKNVIAPTDMEIDCATKTTRRCGRGRQLFDALGEAPQQIVLLDACRNNPFPQCPKRAATSGSGFRGFSRITAADNSLLIANATLSGQLAADGPAGDHSPFAKALLASFEANPKMFMRDLLDQTASDVQLASGGSQVPEITTRGGAPRVCLDEDGCGCRHGGAGGSRGRQRRSHGRRGAQPARPARLRGRRARRARRRARRGDPRIQASAGLPLDGRISPTLVAVLRAATQVASLPKTPKPAPT